jgi:energy-converting hydrogenase B subunit D
MMIFGGILLLLIAVSALGVVRTRNVAAQVLALSFYGLLLAVMFFVFQAPDVALSQIVIGAVALPLIVMLAEAKMQRRERRRRKEGA